MRFYINTNYCVMTTCLCEQLHRETFICHLMRRFTLNVRATIKPLLLPCHETRKIQLYLKMYEKLWDKLGVTYISWLIPIFTLTARRYREHLINSFDIAFVTYIQYQDKMLLKEIGTESEKCYAHQVIQFYAYLCLIIAMSYSAVDLFSARAPPKQYETLEL